MSGRPNDGMGTCPLRLADGGPAEVYYGGATVDGGYWVPLVDAWPGGRLMRRLAELEGLIVGNRWAAFTDDELNALYDNREPWPDGLFDDLNAELERRRAT